LRAETNMLRETQVQLWNDEEGRKVRATWSGRGGENDRDFTLFGYKIMVLKFAARAVSRQEREKERERERVLLGNNVHDGGVEKSRRLLLDLHIIY